MAGRALIGNQKALVFIETMDGCYVPLSHKLNNDGYFRKTWHTGKNRVAEMFHRFIWKARKGSIPEGYEINHLCGNRACQNVAHMECISGHEHAVKTNKERYSAEYEEAFSLWQARQCSATALKDIYGWRAYKWVRKWKKNEINVENT